MNEAVQRRIVSILRFVHAEGNDSRRSCRLMFGPKEMHMLILIIILVLVLGGGGGYYGHSRWGYGGGAGIGLGTILLILLCSVHVWDLPLGLLASPSTLV